MVPRQSAPAGPTVEDRWIDEIPVAALIVDGAGDRVLDANQAAARLATVSHRDLMTRPLSALLVGDDDDAELRIGDRRVSIQIIGSDGWRSAEGPAAVVLLDRLKLTAGAMDDDQLTATCNDLRRQLDEVHHHRDKMASVWAHELKTPLTIIQSYLEILTTELDDGLSEEQLSFLNITRESVLRLRRLVLDLVDIIGFHSGHLSIEPTTVDVAGLLDNLVEEVQPLADTARIELIHERPAVRVSVRADADRVHQILRNLLDNAFKFTPEGGRVTIRTRVEPDWVIVDVVDTGIGIAPEDRERIFEEFVQLKHSGVRPKRHGTGLGLAISREIAAAHGGAIEVESEPTKGSVFSVRLPRERELRRGSA